MIRIVAFFLVFCSLAERSASGAKVDLAKKEGEVVLYTMMVVSDFQVFHKALVMKHPFVKVNHVPQSFAVEGKG